MSETQNSLQFDMLTYWNYMTAYFDLIFIMHIKLSTAHKWYDWLN